MSLRSVQPEGEPRPLSVRSAVAFWLTGALIATLLVAIWLAIPALLVAFASVIIATILVAMARPLERYCGVRHSIALALAAVALLLLPVIAALLIGPQLKAQLGQIAQQLPAAIKGIETQLGISFSSLLQGATDANPSTPGGTIRNVLSDAMSLGSIVLSNLGSAGSFVVNALAGLLVVFFGAFYLAADPARYRAGLVRLFPRRHQAKVDVALGNCGRSLERWLLAQAIAMLAVGTMAGLAAWALGLPAPLAIGVISGLLEFFPVIGPWLGAVPVLLLAFGQGPQVAVLAALMLVAIQQFEANVITPLVQERFAEIPPFLVLFGLVVFGLIFGLIGVLVASPLTLVAYVLVTELYVKDALGQDVRSPGEPRETHEHPVA
ncbi:MAG: AI-2E family transporter [Hyphomicrobiaceae bacterium]